MQPIRRQHFYQLNCWFQWRKTTSSEFAHPQFRKIKGKETKENQRNEKKNIKIRNNQIYYLLQFFSAAHAAAVAAVGRAHTHATTSPIYYYFVNLLLFEFIVCFSCILMLRRNYLFRSISLRLYGCVCEN